MIWRDKFNNKRDINYFIRTNENARGKRASYLNRSTAPSVSSMAGARGERGRLASLFVLAVSSAPFAAPRLGRDNGRYHTLAITQI